MSHPRPPSAGEPGFAELLGGIFRAAGWRLRRQVPFGDSHADWVAVAGRRRYAVVLKIASEGRKDRVIPLLSQALLEAQAHVRLAHGGVIPVGVVATPHISPSLAGEVEQFAARFAPGSGVGILDSTGLHAFHGPGLGLLNAKPAHAWPRKLSLPSRLPDLFSDLNQWLLKILLGQRLPSDLINIPRIAIRNASHLAAIGQVSVMTAFRLAGQLKREGFLEDDGDRLRIVRRDELLERWLRANRSAEQDVPARWLLKQDPEQLFASIARHIAAAANKRIPATRKPARPVRCCLGLFAAAGALGAGMVHGVPPHIYLERLDAEFLRRIGLSLDNASHRPDVFLRLPAHNEAVFRAAPSIGPLPVSDILQIWLDVSVHPARGREQADAIRKRFLKPLFREDRV